MLIDTILKNIPMPKIFLSKEINNNLDSNDINVISNEPIDDHLDVIYQLLHIMTEQVEMFSQKIANEFFE